MNLPVKVHSVMSFSGLINWLVIFTFFLLLIYILTYHLNCIIREPTYFFYLTSLFESDTSVFLTVVHKGSNYSLTDVGKW